MGMMLDRGLDLVNDEDDASEIFEAKTIRRML